MVAISNNVAGVGPPPPGSEDIREYANVFRRRRTPLIVTALVILFGFGATAALLPPVYYSSATILIEQQEIPADLVRSTVTGYADERIQSIAQRVMTTSNLLEIVDKYAMYEDTREGVPVEIIIEGMRSAISLETVSADVVDPRSGKATQATIAFKIGFEDSSPTTAQRVVNELTSLYLNENLKNRRQLAASASGFLADEVERLREEVSVLESRLAEFKQRNAGALPELAALNLQLMDRAERELVEIDRQIRAQDQNRVFLSAQLVQLEPTLEPATAVTSRVIEGPGGRQQLVDAGEQLSALETQYATLAAVYAPEHPDVRRVKRELEALRGQASGAGAAADREALLVRLDVVRRDLAVARDRYSPTHPDVKRLERTEAGLVAQIASSAAALDAAAPTANPAYVQVKSRIEAAQVEIRTLREQREVLAARLGDYEQRLMRTPEVEREYRPLTRDHDNALLKYNEVKDKQLEARMAETLEAEQKGERFELIEPALLPETPVRPNRPAIAMLGLVLAFAGGIGSAVAFEALDPAVHGPRGVARIAGEAPLGVIPHIATPGERRMRHLRRLLAAIVALACVGAGLAAFHQLVMPLDVAWYAALNKLLGQGRI